MERPDVLKALFKLREIEKHLGIIIYEHGLNGKKKLNNQGENIKYYQDKLKETIEEMDYNLNYKGQTVSLTL